jgi:FKBP-type peptidyl-prolyl cis-trans isomerase SlyD
MPIQVISFNCLLKNKAGRFLSSTFNRDVLNAVEDDKAATLNGLARGLQNLSKGEKRIISLTAQEAYGFYDPKKVILYPRKKLPANLRIGESITIVSKKGIHRTYVLLQFHDSLASLDGNHPLAGQDLIFEIEALEARSATDREIAAAANGISRQLLN